jgi:hypothetical protein
MRSTKKTVSLFQSHVFKHEFFLFPVARSLFPLNSKLKTVGVGDLARNAVLGFAQVERFLKTNPNSTDTTCFGWGLKPPKLVK